MQSLVKGDKRSELYTFLKMCPPVGTLRVMTAASAPSASTQAAREPTVQRTHGRGRRLRLAIAIRERGSMGQPDAHCGVHPLAERLRHHHAVGSALRTPSRRHSQYRSGTASSRSARLGRPTYQVLAGRPQELSDRVAHLSTSAFPMRSSFSHRTAKRSDRNKVIRCGCFSRGGKETSRSNGCAA